MSPNDDSRPDEFPRELKPFEASLGALVPAVSRVDRDRLMYLAGAAAATDSSARRPPRLRNAFWPFATAAMVLVSAALGTFIALRPPLERIVYVDRPTTNSHQAGSPLLAAGGIEIDPRSASQAVFADAGYLVLREQVLRRGVDALDAPTHGADVSSPVDLRNRALLNKFLGG